MSSWVQVSTPSGIGAGEQLQQIASNATGLWVVSSFLSGGGQIWTSSDDGASWSAPAALPATLSSITGLQFVHNAFFMWGTPATGTGTNIYRSTDGVTWTLEAANVNFVAAITGSGDGNAMAYGAGLFVLVGVTAATGTTGTSATSPDGLTWTLETTYAPTTGNGFVSVTFDATDFVGVLIDTALTPNYQVANSTDGATWTFQALATIPGSSGVLQGIYFFLGHYIVDTGFDGTQPWLEIATVLSPWNGAQVDTAEYPNSFMAQNGSTVAIGWAVDNGSGDIFAMTTTDGATFNYEPLVPFNGGFASSIARGADGFMSVGFDGTGTNAVMFRSDDLVVPDVTGDTQIVATLALTSAGFTLGPVTTAYSNTVPVGLVSAQIPVGGTLAAPGTAVALIISLGPHTVTVPDVIGLTAALANDAIEAAGLIVGTVSGVNNAPSIPVGDVATQSPAAGAVVLVGTAVDIGISFVVPIFDVDATVISQYANSPTLLALVENFGQYFDPSQNIQDFYLDVWNIDTAQGFGLDIWGIILGVSRIIPIPGTSGAFGFDNSDSPPDWQNFGNRDVATAGGPFFGGQISGASYRLDDGPYRTLLLTKAMANISASTGPALNALITNLFPDRGACYTQDDGNMEMTYVFNFQLTTIELAILTYSGVLAHPAGVGVSITVI